MSRAGSTRNYKSGPKNNWRRAVWNEVLSRTNGREKTEYVLYLAGPQDLDREIAISKGVPPENLIAIDLNKANIAKVRGQQGCAVAGDALDVLWSWPENRRVCAVLLDFCSGLEFNNTGIYDAFEKKSLRSAVVMVNFMRGRDPWSNPIRSALKDAGLMLPTWGLDKGTEEPYLIADANHRGSQFLKYHAWQLWQITRDFAMDCIPQSADGIPDSGTAFDGPGCKIDVPLDEDGQTDLRAWVSLIMGRVMRPEFFTYKSNFLTFDSVVFQHHCRAMDDVPLWMKPAVAISEMNIADRFQRFKETPIVRKLAAMFAVRTMRKGAA